MTYSLLYCRYHYYCRYCCWYCCSYCRYCRCFGTRPGVYCFST
ncbi:hypothetical protein ACIQPQ_02035 [Streptomyces sp. NPDC091281]